ncbi:hypothetical protein FG386_003207 [Cryptosporidium ryanae]|uniref:uncharacterized protein n=1 Tax=Cryptosporidium ryanae TaxID=515981 RepID=UPI00351A6BC6|nr:hypothetical protein FG386_003207 [Cryptosporidium ryanae]
MSGFNIDKLISLSTFNDELNENEILTLSLPTGTTVDLDFENYYYYHNNSSNDEFSSHNKENESFNELNNFDNWLYDLKSFKQDFFGSENFNLGEGLKNGSVDGLLCNFRDFYNGNDSINSKIDSNKGGSFKNNFSDIGTKKGQVKAIVLFLKANLGLGIANNFKEEVESLGAYVYIAENCKQLLEVNNELDGCKRLIVTSADLALNEKLSEEISKKKLSNFLGIVLYCGPHAEYHVKWCSRVSCIKFLSQNLIEVRRAISWIFSESFYSTNEVPNIGRRGKKVGIQEIKKFTQSKIPITNDFPTLGMQGIHSDFYEKYRSESNSIGSYSPFGRSSSNPHDNISSMFRTLAIETKIATHTNNSQLFDINN